MKNLAAFCASEIWVAEIGIFAGMVFAAMGFCFMLEGLMQWHNLLGLIGASVMWLALVAFWCCCIWRRTELEKGEVSPVREGLRWANVVIKWWWLHQSCVPKLSDGWRDLGDGVRCRPDPYEGS